MEKTPEQILDEAIVVICSKYGWVVPDLWAYPGDLIIDMTNLSFFICGDDPKDVAELRRRNVSYRKIKGSLIHDFARVKVKQAIDMAREQEDVHCLGKCDKYTQEEIVKLLKL